MVQKNCALVELLLGLSFYEKRCANKPSSPEKPHMHPLPRRLEFTTLGTTLLALLLASCGGADVECGPGTVLQDGVCTISPDLLATPDVGELDLGGSKDAGLLDDIGEGADDMEVYVEDMGIGTDDMAMDVDDMEADDMGVDDMGPPDANDMSDAGEDFTAPLRTCRGLEEAACQAHDECVSKYGVDIQRVVDAMPALCPTLQQDLTAYEEYSYIEMCPLHDLITRYWKADYTIVMEMLGAQVQFEQVREMRLTGMVRLAVSPDTTYAYETGSSSLDGHCGVGGSSPSTRMGSMGFAEGMFEGHRRLTEDAPPLIEGELLPSSMPHVMFEEARPLTTDVARVQAANLLSARFDAAFSADGVAMAWDTPVYAGCAARRFCTGPEGTIWGRPESGGTCTAIKDGCLPIDWEPCEPEAISLRLDAAVCAL